MKCLNTTKPTMTMYQKNPMPQLHLGFEHWNTDSLNLI